MRDSTHSTSHNSPEDSHRSSVGYPSPHLAGLEVPQLPDLLPGLESLRLVQEAALKVHEYAKFHVEQLLNALPKPEESHANNELHTDGEAHANGGADTVEATPLLTSDTSPFSYRYLFDLAVSSKLLWEYAQLVDEDISNLFEHTHQEIPKSDASHSDYVQERLLKYSSPEHFIKDFECLLELLTTSIKGFLDNSHKMLEVYKEDINGFTNYTTEGAGWLATLKKASDKRIMRLIHVTLSARTMLRALAAAPDYADHGSHPEA